MIVSAAPIAAAITVFGTIYGAGATEVASPEMTLLSSALIFSGAVQFAAVGSLLAGAGTAATVAAAVMLNSRNLLLGAALRTRVRGTRRRRSFLAWWMVDESAGLALTAERSPGRVLLITGILCYVSWLLGTFLGVVGASLVSLEGIAAAVFPVLFVVLAALSTTRRDIGLRAVVAALLSLLLAYAFPPLRGFAPVVAAIAAALPGRAR